MRRSFSALLWKEILELSRLALPALLLFAVFFFATNASAIPLKYDADPTSGPSWFAPLTIVTALAFGVWQTFRESRGDLWGFSVHRPESRRTIFAAKVITGVLTLMLVAGVPYLLSSLWRATPGHRPVPYNWHFLLPGFADLIVGLVFYAAGLFIGAQQRWTRVSAFIAAIAISITVASIESFGVAAAWGVVAAIVLVAAARATYASHSDYGAQPLWGRMAQVIVTGAMVYVGVTMVGAMASAVIATEPYVPPKPPPEGIVTADGTIALLTRVAERNQSTGLRRVTRAVDPNGNPLPALEDTGFLSKAWTGVISNSDPIATDTNNSRYSASTRPYGETRLWVTRLFAQNTEPAWYFERETGLISLYSEKSRRLIGWLGPDGFAAYPNQPRSRFPGVLRLDIGELNPDIQEGVLTLSGGVYRLHGLRKPDLIFAPPAGEAVVAYAYGGMRGGPTPKQSVYAFFTLVTTTRNLYILGADHTIQFVVPYAAHGQNRQIQVMRPYTLPDMPTYVWNFPFQPGTRDSMTYLSVYPRGATAPSATYKFIALRFDDGHDESSGGLTREVRLGSDAGLVSLVPGADAYGYWTTETTTSEYEPPTRKWSWFTLFGLSAVLSLVVLWLARRYEYSKAQTAIWMVLTLVSGPVALITMWLLLDRPAREICPKCKRPRVVTRDLCIHCGAEFNPPPRDGTELLLATS